MNVKRIVIINVNMLNVQRSALRSVIENHVKRIVRKIWNVVTNAYLSVVRNAQKSAEILNVKTMIPKLLKYFLG